VDVTNTVTPLGICIDNLQPLANLPDHGQNGAGLQHPQRFAPVVRFEQQRCPRNGPDEDRNCLRNALRIKAARRCQYQCRSGADNGARCTRVPSQ
jgi:hypothetical protein